MKPAQLAILLLIPISPDRNDSQNGPMILKLPPLIVLGRIRPDEPHFHVTGDLVGRIDGHFGVAVQELEDAGEGLGAEDCGRDGADQDQKAAVVGSQLKVVREG